MFSFTHSSNPFPTFPSSSSSSSSLSYPPFPFYIDPQNGFATNTFLHDPLAVLPFMPSQTPTPQTVTNLSIANYTSMFQKDGINDGSSISKFLTKKPAAKKDRHSKIHTSKGLRDRRVRLSSKIARKFFDLQDMLECDKPSNTLEWLFTKSENAIKELARSKEVESNDKSLMCGAKERKLKWEEKEAKKESREKARARARERTSSKPRCEALELQILHQLMPPIQPHHEAFARYPHLKPSLVSSQHQNLVIPSEASFNNDDYHSDVDSFQPKLLPPLSSKNVNHWIPKKHTFNHSSIFSNASINGSHFCWKKASQVLAGEDPHSYHSLPNSPQNWNTNGASMNLSTELQILGNSWEECTNQRQQY